MHLDGLVAALLAPLAIWVLLNALDDLAVDGAFAFRRLRSASEGMPDDAEIEAVRERRIAIFVPLWKEQGVIGNMVGHNVAAQKYKNYDFFIGAYPNDARTLAAVKDVVRRFPNAHLAVCPHDGPTSKADCLNWIYQRMLLHEEQTGQRFETVLTHDAEDLIHPEALRWINYYAQWYDMVQIPVLALPTPLSEITHGVYCDEFAEFQSKDMPARELLGGFIPSCGVGTGFSRRALEKLAEAHSNRIFEPKCLTEDYENGFRIHRLGLRQRFMPIHWHNGSFIATREYFPRTLDKAVRQRTRWVTGIALQSWELHTFREILPQIYWLWRDRKALIANLTTPICNLLFVYGAGTWMVSRVAHGPWGLAATAHQPWLVSVCGFTMGVQALHISMRATFSARVYGWRFGCAAPLRVLWGNWIGFLATNAAIRRYLWAKTRGQPLVWLKTEHAYPNRDALMDQRRTIGEILVGSGYVSASDLEEALATQPEGMLIGDWLVSRNQLSVEHLYEALALQENVPLGKPEKEEISVPVTRALPAKVSREFSVLPFRVKAGELYIAGTAVPDEAAVSRIHEFCPMEIRFQLVTPDEFAELEEEYLPALASAGA